MDLFKTAFKNSSVGMALVGTNGQWLQVNPALCGSLGYEPEEFLKLSFQDITHPQDLEKDLDFLNECLTNQRDNYVMEKRYIHKNGDIVWAKLSVTAVRENGKLQFFISEILDISEQKKNQKTLATASKMAALGEMAAGIAHEINNPLTVIEGNASILRMELKRLNIECPKAEKRIQNIKNTVMRICAIVNGMRNFARDEDKAPCEDAPLDDIIKESLNVCRMKLRENAIEWEMAGFEALSVQTRRVELAQVFMNLISNSIHAMKEAPVKRLTLKCVVEGEDAVIRVSDTGPEISAEVKNRVMEPFFTTKPHGCGTGLGLSLSKQIMQKMNGSLRYLRDEPSTTFEVSVPLAKNSGKNAA